MGMLLTSSAGNDLPFDDKLCEQGRNCQQDLERSFGARLEVDEPNPPAAAATAVKWMDAEGANRRWRSLTQFANFKLSEALMTTYCLVWEEYCSWYLESIKPPFGSPIDGETKRATLALFERMLKLSIRSCRSSRKRCGIGPGGQGFEDDLCVAAGRAGSVRWRILADVELAKEVVTGIRKTGTTTASPTRRSSC